MAGEPLWEPSTGDIMTLTNQDIACHFHVYQNVAATVDVLERFRRVYSDASIHLISDGGADFSDAAKKHACSYHHEPWNIGRQVNTSEDSINEWLRRFRYVCDESTAPWILILEDDVLIRNQLAADIPYPMAGGSAGRANRRFYNGPLGKYLYDRHPHLVNNGYGGGGGTLVYRTSAIEAIEAYFANESFDHWKSMAGGITASDLWLTTMMMAVGYQYGPNPDMSEQSNWQQTNCAIIHRWKDHSK